MQSWHVAETMYRACVGYGMQIWYEGWVEPRDPLLRAGREERAHAHFIEKMMHDTDLPSPHIRVPP